MNRKRIRLLTVFSLVAVLSGCASSTKKLDLPSANPASPQAKQSSGRPHSVLVADSVTVAVNDRLRETSGSAQTLKGSEHGEASAMTGMTTMPGMNMQAMSHDQHGGKTAPGGKAMEHQEHGMPGMDHEHHMENMKGMDEMQANPTPPKPAASASGTPTTKTPVTAKYTCPMHPEVESSVPGNCPKCGMKLIRKEKVHPL